MRFRRHAIARLHAGACATPQPLPGPRQDRRSTWLRGACRVHVDDRQRHQWEIRATCRGVLRISAVSGSRARSMSATPPSSNGADRNARALDLAGLRRDSRPRGPQGVRPGRTDWWFLRLSKCKYRRLRTNSPRWWKNSQRLRPLAQMLAGFACDTEVPKFARPATSHPDTESLHSESPVIARAI
jgi:hypothetical protein